MIKLFEMFAGYGGASFALKKASIPFECVGFSEIDKHAIKIFQSNHGDIKNYGDSSKITPSELPDFDLLTGGFPCQPFSIAGERKGFDDTRGTLFNDIIRIAEIKKPKYMLLENVAGLMNHEGGMTISIIVNSIRRIGYSVIFGVLNTKDYGVPQNRERIWFVCKRGQWGFNEFRYPTKKPLELKLKDLLEENVDDKYFIKDSQKQWLIKNQQKLLGKGYVTLSPFMASTMTGRQYASWNGNYIQIDVSGKGYKSQQDRFFNTDGVMCCIPVCRTENKVNVVLPCLTPDRKEKRQNRRRLKEDGEPMFTLTGQDIHGVSVGVEIRRLTPKECFRLMGFLKDEIITEGISDSQLYKLAGNGWDINVASLVLKGMLKFN